MRRKKSLIAYAFMAPWLIGFFVFTAWPFLYTVYLSFFNVAQTVTGWERVFVGLDNYNVAFLRNVDFVPALIAFAILQATYAPVITVIAFILALLLNRDIKARGWFRALFFMPVIIMSGPVMYQLLDSGGLGGSVADMTLLLMVAEFSLPLANFLLRLFENYSVVLWFTGIPIILFISGFQKIDGAILEAARIDGATDWQILWKITIPIIKPVVLVSVILTIAQLAGFTFNPALPIIQSAIFQTAGGLGLASAFAWIYSALVLIFIGIAFLLLRQSNDVTPPEIKMRQKTWRDYIRPARATRAIGNKP